jgi:hypothetical protein
MKGNRKGKGGKKPIYQRQIEGILKRLGVGQEEEQQLRASLGRIDAFFEIYEATDIDAGSLIPPDPWPGIFQVMFQTLLSAVPAEKACMTAFAMGVLWKMHEEELLGADCGGRE